MFRDTYTGGILHVWQECQGVGRGQDGRISGDEDVYRPYTIVDGLGQ